MCTLNTKASFTSTICNAMTVHPELELKEIQVSLFSALLWRERKPLAFSWICVILLMLQINPSIVHCLRLFKCSFFDYKTDGDKTTN